MTVATFALTNFNVDDPTTYRGKLDGNASVAAPIVDNFAPHAVSVANMTVQVDAGAIPSIGTIPTTVALQTSATLVAPAVNPRRDIVYIDSVSGVIGVATGTEAVSPIDPVIPAGKIPVARLAMVVGMTTVTNSIITDLRAPALAFSGGGTVTAISANTTITAGQSGSTFMLSGVTVTATLPSPTGNSGVRFRFFGSDANTQTVSTPAATLNFPDGSTAASWGITNNQAIEVQSDGAVWRVLSMVGFVLAQTQVFGDSTNKVATTAFVQQNTVPTGTVATVAMATPPAGWLKCNGAAVSRTTYAVLFAAIGTAYGVGDGTTTFNVPELRGEFIRGFDDARGVDAGRVLGSAQIESVKSHTHGAQNLGGAVAGTAFGTLAWDGGQVNPDIRQTLPQQGGGTETRPRNVALLVVIKY